MLRSILLIRGRNTEWTCFFCGFDVECKNRIKPIFLKDLCDFIMCYFNLKNQSQARENSTVLCTINRFLASPWFVAAVMLLTAAANICSLELAVYSVFAAAAVYICLFGDDLLGLMPITICCYIAPSVKNNPGRSDQSVFAVGHGGGYMICLAVLIGAALLFRIIRDRRTFFRKKYTLLSGMLGLLGAYLLSGLGSPAYPDSALKNIFFAFLQGSVIIVPYFLFSGGVNWRKARQDYFAWVGFGTGCLLLCQIFWIYCSNHVVVDGVIRREQIYTGWGMHNNIGGLLAMMIPFAFYLAAKYRRGWIGTVAGSAFLVGVLLTCSRSSILAGTAIYLVCIFLMLHYARSRRNNTIALAAVIVAVLLAVLLFHKQILQLFSDLLKIGMDPSTRDEIYLEGLKLFGQYPVFGGSFYSPGYTPWEWSTAAGFTGFFPPRWHNTVIQLLASCGVVGLGAYLLHRVQTLRLFLRNSTKEKTFIGCALLVLLAGSMFDCHFFNLGPVLFYSMGLAFAENSTDSGI